MSRLALDLKVAVRTLIRARTLSTLAIVAFALGIGITTAVFSIFAGVLLAPLPFPEPDRLVVVYDTQPACPDCPASYPKYIDWKTRNQVFSAIGGAAPVSFVLTGNGDPVRLRGFLTTASFRDVFALQPEIGRWFTEDEDRPGGPKLVVLAHDVWVERFGRDPAIVGTTLTLNDGRYEVIGVMPAAMSSGFRSFKPQLFVPLQRKLDPSTRGSHFLATMARLKPGVMLARARSEMRTLGDALAREFGNNHGIDVRAYSEAMVGDLRTPLRVLLGAVLLLLLVACANVANLLLVSGLARRHELAIRLALGANTKDLARQLTIESVALALAGGTIGVVLARWILRTFLVLAGNQLPRVAGISIDARVLAFSAATSLAVGIVCGIWPLVVLRNRELVAAVREGDNRAATPAGRRFGDALVVVEIALAFALIVGAALLVKNLILLRSRDAGIRPDRIVTLQLTTSGARYRDEERQVAFYRDLYARLTQVGSIESVGLISHLPMLDFGYNGEFQVEGGTPWRPDEAPLVEYRWLYGDYVKTMGIRLLAGRMLNGDDRRGSTTVLINHAMAEKFWPGQDAIGKRFGQGSDRSKWYEVVGVLSDVRSRGLAQPPPYEFYRTLEESPFPTMTVAVRTHDADPLSVVPTVRRIVGSIDPALPLTNVQTMEHVLGESVGRPRLMSALTALFGSLAALLAMVGVYSVMAYRVSRQRREFGIRLALGADALRVRNLVVGRAMALGVVGVACGAFAAWLLTRVLATMLNDVKPADGAVFAGTAGGVLLVALAASYFPARAAGRVDPILALRDQ